MGRKNLVTDFKPINGGDMSLVEVIGQTSTVKNFDTVTYTAKWTGGNTLNGNLEIQKSKDGIDWSPLDFGTQIALSGATGAHEIIINEIGFTYLRPVYKRTDGGATGSLIIELFSTNKGA